MPTRSTWSTNSVAIRQQMDFKGHLILLRGGRCHPLTVLDDHSRFLIGLRACANQTTATVREALTAIFARYGLPAWLIVDNGSPWGSDRDHNYTPLTAWLMRLLSDVWLRATTGERRSFSRTS